jgi:putative sigma-54 modulation protein
MNIISSEVEDESSDGPKVIRSEQIFAKPMDVEEAIMQLDLSQELFLVFTDASTETINVLYRREDGNYGLIEPIPE